MSQQIIGLLRDQEQAEQAVNELLAADLEDSSIQTIDKSSINPESGLLVLPVHQGGAGGFTGAAFSSDSLKNLTGDDSDARQFFQRNLERGGVLIIVEPSDEMAFTQAKRILEEQGAQIIGS
jgi:hypothetical protein